MAAIEGEGRGMPVRADQCSLYAMNGVEDSHEAQQGRTDPAAPQDRQAALNPSCVAQPPFLSGGGSEPTAAHWPWITWWPRDPGRRGARRRPS